MKYCSNCQQIVEPKIVELVKGTPDETCPICTSLNLTELVIYGTKNK